MKKLFAYLFKNIGLISSIIEIVLKAALDIIAQIVKAIAGIVNVLQPSRSKDSLVKLAEKLEALSKAIDKFFTAIKKWLYSFGG